MPDVDKQLAEDLKRATPIIVGCSYLTLGAVVALFVLLARWLLS